MLSRRKDVVDERTPHRLRQHTDQHPSALGSSWRCHRHAPRDRGGNNEQTLHHGMEQLITQWCDGLVERSNPFPQIEDPGLSACAK